MTIKMSEISSNNAIAVITIMVITVFTMLYVNIVEKREYERCKDLNGHIVGTFDNHFVVELDNGVRGEIEKDLYYSVTDYCRKPYVNKLAFSPIFGVHGKDKGPFIAKNIAILALVNLIMTALLFSTILILTISVIINSL